MNLSIEQARELGEAIIDACENSITTGGPQTVAFINDNKAVAMPIHTSEHVLDVDYVLNVLT